MHLKTILNPAGAAALLAAALASSPAASQPQADAGACRPAGADRRLAFGECRSSSLGAGDPTTGEGLPYEDWRIRLERGQAVQIEMDAAPMPRAAGEPEEAGGPQPSFDAFLELRRDGAGEPLESNDDRPGSLNSRLRYTPTESGDYVVRARPLASEEGGNYVLRVSVPPPPPVAAALEPGRTQGSIDRSAPESEEMAGFRGRHYAFQANEGDRIRLALASRAETAMLQVKAPSGRTISAESMEGTASNLFAVLPETGRYLVEVYLPDAQAAVPFTLDFERRAASPARAPRPIRVGESASGELGLGSGDAADPYGEGMRILAETYVLAVEAGRPVTVTLESPAFDTVLEAGGMTPLGFAAAVSNDDYGDGLNSRLVLRPEQSGTVQLRVRALGTGAGPFSLRVEPGAAAPLQEAAGDDHHH